jgi:hypothetical protein
LIETNRQDHEAELFTSQTILVPERIDFIVEGILDIQPGDQLQ